MSKIILLFHTLKFLKPIQFYFRTFYLVRKKVRLVSRFKYQEHKKSKAKILKLQEGIINHQTYQGNFKFNFLNLEKDFEKKIDWNYPKHGKLWTYNLNYFEFLNQKNINKEEGLILIHDFIDNIATMKDALEPFPLSLRGLNWIKFLCQHNIQDATINDNLYAQYYQLLDNLEYHILGNHLLENAFSLLFAGYYFQDIKFRQTAKKLLEIELNEQILKDGAHFELSPMYHQLMLFRLLDIINLIKNNSNEEEFLTFLTLKATHMLGWLNNISYADGSIPRFNDSTNGIAPHSNELFSYAKTLNIDTTELKLADSGYRKISMNDYESIIDVSSIKASYIAGHTHADTFSFEVFFKGEPFIVNCGISTYEDNKRRAYERGTSAHNTVSIQNTNSSEIWSSFRVGKRATVIDIEEQALPLHIKATHNGYQSLNVKHTRTFKFEESSIVIEDQLSNYRFENKCFIHFHPNVTEDFILKHVHTNKKLILYDYLYAEGYNNLKKAKYIIINFDSLLQTRIIFEK